MTAAPTSFEIAQAALQWLLEQRLDPNPENYARAWAACGGTSEPAPAAQRRAQRPQPVEGGAAQQAPAGADESALVDRLTQTLSRRGLRDAWRAALQRARRLEQAVALALLDVDDFAGLDQAFGRSAGDEALRHLARLLQARLRPGDSVGRPDGAAFVLLLPGSTAQGATDVMQRLQRELVRDTYLFETSQVALRVSVGIAQGGGEDEFDAVLARADAALAQARRAGGDRVVVSRVEPAGRRAGSVD